MYKDTRVRLQQGQGTYRVLLFLAWKDSFWCLSNHAHVYIGLYTFCLAVEVKLWASKPLVSVEQSADFSKLNPAQMVNNSCVACASARPLIYTKPAPLIPFDQTGYDCMLALTREKYASKCSPLASVLPFPRSSPLQETLPRLGLWPGQAFSGSAVINSCPTLAQK